MSGSWDSSVQIYQGSRNAVSCTASEGGTAWSSKEQPKALSKASSETQFKKKYIFFLFTDELINALKPACSKKYSD